MPKKIKLSELLYEVDGDFMRDIILELVQNQPELEEQIRMAIVPKKLINNPISYYKKQLIDVPNNINDKSKAKLAIEICNKLVVTANAFEKASNYFESTKIYQSLIEVLLPKTKKYYQKEIENYLEKIIQQWTVSISKIPEIDERQTCISFLIQLHEQKVFKEDLKIVGFMVKTSQYLLTEPEDLYYYKVFNIFCKYLTDPIIIENISENISSQKSSKYLISKIYLLKNSKKTEEFTQTCKKNIEDIEVMNILTEYYFENNQVDESLEVIFDCLSKNKYGFEQKSSDTVKLAIQYLELCHKYSKKDTINYQQVLIWLTTVGSNYWAYDVSSKAKFWDYYKELRNDFASTWSENYAKIVDILIEKQLTKQLLEIIFLEKDSKTMYLNFVNSSEVDLAFDFALVCCSDYPDLSLDKLIRYIRYKDPHFWRAKADLIERLLQILDDKISEVKKTDLIKLKKKFIEKKNIKYGWGF